MTSPAVDVAVVGLGPTGKVLAARLARQGMRVVALERRARSYPLPRAVSIDGPAREILGSLGLAGVLARHCAPAADYRITDGADRERVRIPMRDEAGRPRAWSVYQPAIERALDEVLEREPGVRVQRGSTCTGVDPDSGTLTLRSQDRQTSISAGVVVAADGARSTLREAAGLPMRFLPFRADWIACDLRPAHGGDVEVRNDQVAAARPYVAVNAGPDHLRREFMRLPRDGEPAPDGAAEAWRLLEEIGLSPREHTLVRHAAYTVRAGMAERWSTGRLVLAGDAAHVMPPFAGQGMCSGLKDAAALADALAGPGTGPQQLERYEEQRRPDAERMLRLSVRLGELVCSAASDVVGAGA